MWFGAPLGARPVTVVDDTDDVLALYVPVGTRWFGPQFDDRERALDEVAERGFRFGELVWHTHNVLILVREGDPYSAQAFWRDDDKSFAAWYVNLQEPYTRSSFGIDTRDHSLDIIAGADLSWWLWKDEEETERAVRMGLFSREEYGAIRRDGEQVVEMIKAGNAWWTSWLDWVPDPSWPIPTLPEGWDRT